MIFPEIKMSWTEEKRTHLNSQSKSKRDTPLEVIKRSLLVPPIVLHSEKH